MKRSGKEAKSAPARISGLMLAGLVFASGFAGLVYQLLWMRQLGLLFGNTAQAAAVTLAAFFAGLGAGSAWWGRRVGRSAKPLGTYAFLEWGIAAAAMVYFGIFAGFDALYPTVRSAAGGGAVMLAVKFLLALLLVFPPAFFMGGTVPVMGQVAIRDRQRFGQTGAWLYAVNTVGAALGVACAAFSWIPSLGFGVTYGLALLLSIATGAVAWLLARHSEPVPAATAADEEWEPATPRWETWALGGLGFTSGFVILALEVIWTRLFAQVHENSVYSYAIILIVVLLGLAVGAALSALLARVVKEPWRVLGVVMLVGGSLLVVGPATLWHVTDGLAPVHTFEAWGEYVRGLFKTGIRGIGFVVIALGMVFPFLMKVAERQVRLPGRMLGRLLAVNTLGAIIGALVGGFVLLPVFGMWDGLKWLSGLYLAVALVLPLGWGKWGLGMRGVAVGGLVLLFTVLDPGGYPVMGKLKGKSTGKVLEVWQDSGGMVAVVERPGGHRAIVVDGGYKLGSTEAYLEQANQARIPLYLFPETESLCFVGFGTGISVGAAFDEDFPSVERVVSCELSRPVVEAARKWIPEPMTGGVFDDPRSEILIEDGRHFLRASGERFDMINADLFLPYRRGAGSLYSRDHYEVVARCLNPGGVFVQWLPLYQLTEDEFGTIARTMLESFQQVTMWRNNFAPGHEKVALIGRMDGGPVPVPPGGEREAMRRAVAGLDWRGTTPDMMRVEPESLPFLYAGNLTQAAELFAEYPVNTDNRPVIEYQTPKRFREVAREDKVIWCVGPKLLGWMDRIFAAAPVDEDPVWAGHPESNRHLVEAGLGFHRAMVAKAVGDREQATQAWEVFQREWQSGAR